MTSVRYTRYYDTMAKQLFHGFVRKTEEFRAILGAEMRTSVREFCPTDEKMIHYIERWINDIRRDRVIGYANEKYIDGDDTGKWGATEHELLQKMLEFFEEEHHPIIEMFGQIDDRRPTIIKDEDYGRLLDYPYSGGVAIYQKEMLDLLTKSGNYSLHRPDDAFTARVLNMEVEEWMRNFTIEYLTDKLKDTTASPTE